MTSTNSLPDAVMRLRGLALSAGYAAAVRAAARLQLPDAFDERSLTKAGYAANPLEDDSLAEFALHTVDLTGMTVEAVKEFGLSRKDASRAKNMFALGLVSWMYGRPTESTITFL